jgi:hypothetical protein
VNVIGYRLEVVGASYLAIPVMMTDALPGLQTSGSLVGPVVQDRSGLVIRDDANRALKLWGAHSGDDGRS